MGEPIAPPASTLEATFKGREFEGILDLYFYRRVGFRLAQFFARLKMTPSGVTLLGGLFGLCAGHLYYYQDLRLNFIGMLLHICANAFDNADGQLARLTNSQSRNGRIIDSLVDHAIFINIYLHLGLRLLNQGFPGTIALLVISAGLSHGLQAAAADYSRNAFLYFVRGRGDFDSSQDLSTEFRQLRWSDSFGTKLLLAIYRNATRQQEGFAPHLVELKETVNRQFANGTPAWWRNRYREMVGPSFRLWGFLMTNTRMLLLFLVLILGQPVWFFWAELTVFNVLFIALLLQQRKMSDSLLNLVAKPGAVAAA